MSVAEMTDIEARETDAVLQLGAARDRIVNEVRKTIVGMDEVIDEMMIAVFCPQGWALMNSRSLPRC